MVRVLSCHHFSGQHVGRCEEAIGVAAAGVVVIVALEHQVNIYVPAHLIDRPKTWFPDRYVPPVEGPDTNGSNLISGIPGLSAPAEPDSTTEIGRSYVYHRRTYSGSYLGGNLGTSGLGKIQGASNVNPKSRAGSASGTRSADTPSADTQLKLSHSFSTVDLIDSLTYNKKGHYLLCLEKREVGSGTKMTSVRIYFHWERKPGPKPMRARIAGLVSPTGTEHDDDALMMVEIPLTSPATAVASCKLSGHIACLSAESIINIFMFRMKEGSGRLKMHYADFDRMYAVELPGFAPQSICFLSDYIACMNDHQVTVFRMTKEEKSGVGSATGRKTGFNLFSPTESKISAVASMISANTVTEPEDIDGGNSKVVFDPKNETVKVHLNTILRSNRRKKAPASGIYEEYPEDIFSNRTKVIFTAVLPGIFTEDILRLTSSTNATNASPTHSFIKVGLYPIRTNDTVGGVACWVGTAKEVFLYHMPERRECYIVRVINYPLTAPLISFTFDSLFFHCLTEAGLETYTCRSLYYALRDTEDFQKYINDCPFQDEATCLVGIRPFLGVRFMAANELCMCLLACPTSTSSHISEPSPASPVTPPAPLTNQEENSWTAYSLDLPDLDLIYDDANKAAQLHKESNPETYFTLICELHILLRLYINAHPETEAKYRSRYQETCRIIGFNYFKKSTSFLPSARAATNILNQSQERSLQNDKSIDDMVDKGVTYLQMAHCDFQYIFGPEHTWMVKDPLYIPGFVKFIEVVLPTYQFNDVDATKIPPSLSPVLVEFLATHSPRVLVDMVIQVPFLRECNSTRLVQILKELTEKANYRKKESLALLFTVVTLSGGDAAARAQVKDILSKTKAADLGTILILNFLLDRKNNKVCMTDLCLCMAAAKSQLPGMVISRGLKSNELTISEAMLAFAQAVNLNADTQVQQCLTKVLSSILESYFADKLTAIMNHQDLAKDRSIGANQIQPAGISLGLLNSLTEDETRAVFALVRSYLTHISLSLLAVPTNAPVITSNPVNLSQLINSVIVVQNGTSSTLKNGTSNTNQQSNTASSLNYVPHPVNEVPPQNYQIFGKTPTFVNYILTMEYDGGLSSGFNQGQNILTFSRFSNEECREHYIKLTSLLGSIFGNLDGVKDLVKTFLQRNGVLNSPLHLVLQLLVDPAEKAIATLIAKQPTTQLLYAKEMFGRSTVKWKNLVGKLKEKINSNPEAIDADIFSTIIESVYLHLANTLTPAELEEVLDKGEQNAKFHTTCKRVELANTYANMVISISSEYLNHQQ